MTIGQYLLSQGYFFVGDFSRAMAHFQATLNIAEQTRNLFLPGVLLWTAETEARLGRYDEAIGHVRNYETLIGEVGSLEGLAWFPSQGACDRIYGIIFAQRGEPARARQHFERSIQILSEHGYKPDLARSYLALGQFLRDQERLTEARDALEKAFVLFREMGFTRERGQTLGILKTMSR